MSCSQSQAQSRIMSELTGQLVPIDSEEWRFECEVAYLLAVPPEDREFILEGVPGEVGYKAGLKGVRGEAAVAELRVAIERLAEIRRRGWS